MGYSRGTHGAHPAAGAVHGVLTGYSQVHMGLTWPEGSYTASVVALRATVEIAQKSGVGNGSSDLPCSGSIATSAPGFSRSCPHLRRDLGSPVPSPHLRRDLGSSVPVHICAGTWARPFLSTSAPGLGLVRSLATSAPRSRGSPGTRHRWGTRSTGGRGGCRAAKTLTTQPGMLHAARSSASVATERNIDATAGARRRLLQRIITINQCSGAARSRLSASAQPRRLPSHAGPQWAHRACTGTPSGWPPSARRCTCPSTP
jgi:hypothetical protein